VLTELKERGLITLKPSELKKKIKKNFDVRPRNFEGRYGQSQQFEKHFIRWEKYCNYNNTYEKKKLINNNNKITYEELIHIFKIISIQVDGGSEFMKYFENTCKET
jgi:hypothetical protein